jgi:hypothetical protein
MSSTIWLNPGRFAPERRGYLILHGLQRRAGKALMASLSSNGVVGRSTFRQRNSSRGTFMMGGTLSVDLERLAGARVLVFFFLRIVQREDILAVSHNEKAEVGSVSLLC